MLLGIERVVVEEVRVELGAIVVSVRPKSREQHRCRVCGRRCPREDSGEGRRRWRALDLGTTFAYVNADAPRVYAKAVDTAGESQPAAKPDDLPDGSDVTVQTRKTMPVTAAWPLHF
jgi:hypothetical protein